MAKSKIKVEEDTAEGASPPIPRQEVANKDEQRSGYSVPRDMVLLPSMGKLYGETHPLHKEEFIEVRHLTAADEDILTSRSLLRSGKALDHLLQSCIVDKSISVDDLVSGDKNSIMTFLRISGYGPDYEVRLDCPSCEEENNYTFDLSGLAVRTLDLNPEDVNNPAFDFALPSGINIKFRFLTSMEENEIQEVLRVTKQKTGSPLERNITTRYSKQILSVNGDDSPETISNFVKSMSIRDSRAFRKYLNDNEPDVIMKQPFTCSYCGHKEEVDIPIGVGFFWPE